MNGMVNIPKMLETTVSRSARDTLPPSCCDKVNMQPRQNASTQNGLVSLVAALSAEATAECMHQTD